MRINKHDTNGTKPLLGKGELGYDDYAAGGDVGRVYVGTGSENIALAERLESNMMTKAQFNALAEERKANRAGSGFDEFGKHAVSTNNYPNINEGMFVSVLNNAIYNGNIKLGYTGVDNTGVSKTNYPITNVNGVRHRVDNGGASNNITLPTAPNIYPHDTVLTAEQINSGVIKHADASNSGLIVNGKFDTDTSGWNNLSTGTGSILYSGGRVLLSGADGSNRGAISQVIPTVIGKKYTAELNIEIVSGSLSLFGTSVGSGGVTASNGRNTYEFTAINASTTILFYTSSASGSAYIDNIAVYPADAISRSDLVFLESWHEDVSEKNFVYPLGNVQYLGANTDGLTGITNGNFTGFETYSLFGNWQSPSSLIGKGYVWSSLSEAQKKAFISNPDNNCYLDGDKVIQVRYRMRVIQGARDTWATVDPQMPGSFEAMSSVRLELVVAAKGKRTSINDLISNVTGSNDHQVFWNDSSTLSGLINKSTGAFSIPYTTTGIAYEGKCFALPIALAQKRNQGMYHNVYNPNGTKVASDGLDCFKTAVSFTSISDCFDSAKLLTASGYIGSASGRPDGLFYDQVHESDILDLRNSSKKVEDYNRLIGREFNKLVAGTTRGKEGESDIVMIRTFTKTSTFGQDNNRFYFGISSAIYPQQSFSLTESNSYYLLGSNGSVYSVNQIINQSATGTLYVPFGTTQVYVPIDGKNTAGTMNTLFPDGTTITVIVAKRTTRTKSNTLLHCDIIGNPTNYPTAWKESGVFGTPLIVAEDGTSLLPDGVRDTFKLSRKANATPLLCLRSTDNGVTWTSFTPTFSTTTNAITLTDEPANNLVMVYYQTKTSMAVPVVNSEVLEIGDVFATSYSSRSPLVSSLIEKVPTYQAGIAGVVPTQILGKPTNYIFNYLSKIENTDGYRDVPQHKSTTLTPVTTPSIKVFPYLTRLNGKAYLNLVFKEMKHNGTSWGDSNKFEIVDKVSTTTDNNAQTVLIGQKTVELPYFIAGDE